MMLEKGKFLVSKRKYYKPPRVIGCAMAAFGVTPLQYVTGKLDRKEKVLGKHKAPYIISSRRHTVKFLNYKLCLELLG